MSQANKQQQQKRQQHHLQLKNNKKKQHLSRRNYHAETHTHQPELWMDQNKNPEQRHKTNKHFYKDTKKT